MAFIFDSEFELGVLAGQRVKTSIKFHVCFSIQYNHTSLVSDSRNSLFYIRKNAPPPNFTGQHVLMQLAAMT